MDRCTCHDTLVVKDLNRWFKEKWVDVSRKDPKTGKHPPCGRSKAKKSSKGYPKCRPSVKVSSKTPKTSGSMTTGQKRAATKRKRAKKQGVGGKPTIVKSSPMEDAWLILKAPPEYHATFDMEGVMSEGIRGGSTSRRSKRHVPESLRGEDNVSYTWPTLRDAQEFQARRLRETGLDPARAGIVQVDERELPPPTQHPEPHGNISLVRPGGIPASVLSRVQE